MAMQRYKSVDAYMDAQDHWQKELAKLREILNSTELEESVKWGAPCYTINGKNVVGILGFKFYFGLWFHQGVFMKDKYGVMMNCQEGKTRGLRQWRMTDAKQIKVRQVKTYLKEAIELAKAGTEIKPQRGKPVVVPDELLSAFKKNKKAAAEFKALTIGKKREFAEYVSDAKRAETKVKRIAKILPMLIAGEGLNDKYR